MSTEPDRLSPEPARSVPPSGGLVGEYPLGPLEKMAWAYHEHLDGDGQVAFILRVEGVLERDVLERALCMVQRRHPKLRSRLRLNDQGVPCLQVLDDMPITDVDIVDCETDELPWLAEGMKHIADKLDTLNGPLWRLSVVRCRRPNVSEILFVAHHAITDAVSAVCFFDNLLKCCTWLQDAQAKRPQPFVESDPLPVVMSPKLPITVSRWTAAWELLRIVSRQGVARGRGSWHPLPASESMDAPAHWCRMLFTAEQTVALRTRCREEETTMLGALFAAAAGSVAVLLKEPALELQCRFAINVRTLTTPPVGNEDMGFFASGFEKAYQVKATSSFWDQARQARHDLTGFMKRQGPAITSRLMRWVRLNPPRLPARRETMGISNFGEVALQSAYGSFAPRSFSVIGRNRWAGPSLNVMAVSLNGRLNVTLGVVDVAEGFREAYCESFRKRIEEAAGVEVARPAP